MTLVFTATRSSGVLQHVAVRRSRRHALCVCAAGSELPDSPLEAARGSPGVPLSRPESEEKAPEPRSSEGAAARIAAARRYKSGGGSPSTASSEGRVAATSAAEASATFDGTALRRSVEDLAGRSLIEQAAATQPTNSGLTPEMETLQRDNRPREIEFISVDKSYKPKVSTWGVFPRPDNISEAFGGGRNLTPGAPLEPDSASSARLARVRAVVGNYKLAAGLEVDPSDEAFVAEELRAGEALLSAGRLEAAAASFRSAADRAPLMSGEGGTARLRLALCLDSSGDSEGAKVLYTALGRHPDAEVKKQASRLLWGMTEATAFMKADAFDYMAGMREEYETYLMKPVMLEGLVSGGAGDAEELAAVNRATAAAALALVALPVGLLLAVRAAAMHARASAHG